MIPASLWTRTNRSISIRETHPCALSGLTFDQFLHLTKHRHKTERRIHDLCEREHCGCEDEDEGSIVHAALVHTIHIVLFIFLISLLLTILVEGFGENRVAGILTDRPVAGTINDRRLPPFSHSAYSAVASTAIHGLPGRSTQTSPVAPCCTVCLVIFQVSITSRRYVFPPGSSIRALQLH